jgi:hypothetical protein
MASQQRKDKKGVTKSNTPMILDFALTRFLVMMAFDRELGNKFHHGTEAEKEEAMEGWDLDPDDIAALTSGNLEVLKQAFSTQSGDTRDPNTKRSSAKKDKKLNGKKGNRAMAKKGKNEMAKKGNKRR